MPPATGGGNAPRRVQSLLKAPPWDGTTLKHTKPVCPELATPDWVAAAKAGGGLASKQEVTEWKQIAAGRRSKRKKSEAKALAHDGNTAFKSGGVGQSWKELRAERHEIEETGMAL